MNDGPRTCWDLVAGAATGDAEARRMFGETYAPIVRGYLSRRWIGRSLIQELDDALQEVFVECFRDGGALTTADPGKGSGFRGFLYGVTRNVALRHERASKHRDQERSPKTGFLEQVPDDERYQSQLFDREWARGIVRQAGDLQEQRATARGGNAVRRLEVLRRRFEQGQSVSEIADAMDESPELIHKWSTRARADFRDCLHRVVADHMREPDSPNAIEQECLRLLTLLE